jgi:hypothetical protein
MVVEITSSLHVSVAAWANKLNHLSFAQASHVFFVVFYTYWVMQHMGNTTDIQVHMSYLIRDWEFLFWQVNNGMVSW